VAGFAVGAVVVGCAVGAVVVGCAVGAVVVGCAVGAVAVGCAVGALVVGCTVGAVVVRSEGVGSDGSTTTNATVVTTTINKIALIANVRLPLGPHLGSSLGESS
jgi:hypothetical protein